MVDCFDWQNVSAPRGPSSVAKRYKTDHLFGMSLQLKKALLGPKRFANQSYLPRVFRPKTDKLTIYGRGKESLL